MLTRLATKPEPVLTRKQVREARMKAIIQLASQEAIQTSLAMTGQKTAWVYILVVPGQKATTIVRTSHLQESTLGSGSILKPVSGYQKGKKVWG